MEQNLMKGMLELIKGILQDYIKLVRNIIIYKKNNRIKRRWINKRNNRINKGDGPNSIDKRNIMYRIKREY